MRFRRLSKFRFPPFHGWNRRLLIHLRSRGPAGCVAVNDPVAGSGRRAGYFTGRITISGDISAGCGGTCDPAGGVTVSRAVSRSCGGTDGSPAVIAECGAPPVCGCGADGCPVRIAVTLSIVAALPWVTPRLSRKVEFTGSAPNSAKAPARRITMTITRNTDARQPEELRLCLPGSHRAPQLAQTISTFPPPRRPSRSPIQPNRISPRQPPPMS